MHNHPDYCVAPRKRLREDAPVMDAIWTVRDSNGDLLDAFTGASRLEVGCKVMPRRYDAFRLHVSASYRELFDRALAQILDQEQWEIIRVR